MTVKEFMNTQPFMPNYMIIPKRLMSGRTLETFDDCMIKKVALDINYLEFEDGSKAHMWLISIDPKEFV